MQTPQAKIFTANFAKNGISNNQEGMDTATRFLTDFITNTAIKAGSQDYQIKFTSPPKKIRPTWSNRGKKVKRKIMPKWHDATCVSIQKQINLTSKLLKNYPNSQYLKTQLFALSKQ